VWGSLGDLTGLWTAEASLAPEVDVALADAAHEAWWRSVERSRHCVSGDDA
jgi:hypothetical protein